MPQSALFTGIIPPVSTIFTADGQLDKQGTAALIDDLIKAGVDGLFFLGSGGEFSQLGAEERNCPICYRSCRSSRAGPDRHRRHQRPGNH